MRLEQHITDTLKEWELKLGGIEGGIRLYYPCDSVQEYLGVEFLEQNAESWLAQKTRVYLEKEAPYLGAVKTEYHEGRIAIQIPEEGCQYVSEQIEYPKLLVELLPLLKKPDLEPIRALFEAYAKERGGRLLEDKEEQELGCVLFFDCDAVDPYVYCFDADDFGITYHRFAREDYKKLSGKGEEEKE